MPGLDGVIIENSLEPQGLFGLSTLPYQPPFSLYRDSAPFPHSQLLEAARVSIQEEQ